MTVGRHIRFASIAAAVCAGLMLAGPAIALDLPGGLRPGARALGEPVQTLPHCGRCDSHFIDECRDRGTALAPNVIQQRPVRGFRLRGHTFVSQGTLGGLTHYNPTCFDIFDNPIFEKYVLACKSL